MSGGPLAGIRIVELAGLGALPFGTGKLGDMGADVIRVHRTTEVPSEPKAQVCGASRASPAIVWSPSRCRERSRV